MLFENKRGFKLKKYFIAPKAFEDLTSQYEIESLLIFDNHG